MQYVYIYIYADNNTCAILRDLLYNGYLNTMSVSHYVIRHPTAASATPSSALSRISTSYVASGGTDHE